MNLILIGISAFVVTLIGGYLALRFKDRLHLILGFSAGTVMGVALFDLIPEAIDIGQHHYSIYTLTSFVAFGFALYLILDRAMAAFYRSDNGLGATSLIIHSVMDGLAIGLAFQVSPAVGIVVAIAVLVHDFSDGINTVNMSLLSSYSNAKAKIYLGLDAIAPLLGIALSQIIVVPEQYLAVLLSLFAGFFLYIGASELIPESQHRHPHFWTSFMTILGMLLLYIAVYFSKL